LADVLAKEVPGAQVELIDGGRGDFIVHADGELVWDKKGADGGFPSEAEVLARLGKLNG